MLTIKNLSAGIDGKPILNGIDLEIAAGEVDAITNRETPRECVDEFINPWKGFGSKMK